MGFSRSSDTLLAGERGEEGSGVLKNKDEVKIHGQRKQQN
jgi:hypothetical protein